jgi:hypothetical protein
MSVKENSKGLFERVNPSISSLIVGLSPCALTASVGIEYRGLVASVIRRYAV